MSDVPFGINSKRWGLRLTLLALFSIVHESRLCTVGRWTLERTGWVKQMLILRRLSGRERTPGKRWGSLSCRTLVYPKELKGVRVLQLIAVCVLRLHPNTPWVGCGAACSVDRICLETKTPRESAFWIDRSVLDQSGDALCPTRCTWVPTSSSVRTLFLQYAELETLSTHLASFRIILPTHPIFAVPTSVKLTSSLPSADCIRVARATSHGRC